MKNKFLKLIPLLYLIWLLQIIVKTVLMLF